MLLRRFLKQLKEQPWTAIGIEFAIVVVGVFLGLQVQNWNLERSQREAAVVYHGRLIEEVRRNEHNLVQRRDYYRTVLAHAERALAELEAKGFASNDYQGQFLVDVYQATQRWLLSVDRGVYDELISSGVMNTVLEPEARTRLTNYYVIFDSIQTSVTDDIDFRKLVRAHMPVAIQRDIEASGGDQVVVDAKDAISITIQDAVPEWSPKQVRDAVASLLTAPELKLRLNFRISDIDTKLKVLERRIGRSQVLAAYFEEVGPKK